jgi:NADPH:quinone reductase-like Zn-dependent oxidoreductase
MLVFVGMPTFRFIKPMLRVVRGTLTSRFAEQKALMYITEHSQDDLLVMKELLEAGTVKPVVDRAYPLSEAAEAIRYVEQNRAKGKVVVTI